MIARIAGTLAAKTEDRAVVDTAGGIGYEILVPRDVLERLPSVGSTVELATQLVVREDGWSLYGFRADRDRKLFQRLLSATGVGPRLALALISGLGAARVVRALRERDLGALASVSGVGKKTAERLALELGDKLDDVAIPEATEQTAGAPAQALEALVRLGYARLEADTAIRAVLAANGTDDIATLIRKALQQLAHA